MFPYVMVMFCLIPLLANLAWRVMDLDELAHGLSGKYAVVKIYFSP